MASRQEESKIITETFVVEIVCKHLKNDGWTIRSFCRSRQHGDDIVATRGAKEIRIEAKGEGSEQPTSNRFGKRFTKNQVRSHVAEIETAIRDLGMVVFWVADNGSVRGSD